MENFSWTLLRKFGKRLSNNMYTQTMQSYSILIEQDLKDKALKEGILRIVVGGVILSKDNSSLLLLKRHPSDFMPNIEELPSGAVHEGETLRDAVLREIHEETGLIASEVKLYLNSFDYSSRKGVATRQFNFLVTTKNWEPVTLSPNEHTNYSWRAFHQKAHLSEQMCEILDVLSHSL